VADLIKRLPIQSKNVIAHIRKATQGEVMLENCHPFVRMRGRYWVFAHNGDLKEFAPELDGSFLPVGTTDSERAFCYILQQMRHRFGGFTGIARADIVSARDCQRNRRIWYIQYDALKR
jgi:glutamine amidotransferase